MTNMKTLIEREFDTFFEFETDNRDVVTSTSAKLFAEHVLGIATAPESPAVRGELVGWQFYKHGKWWNGDDRIKNQRKNIEKKGVRVRNVYAEPQLAEQQPATDVQGEPFAWATFDGEGSYDLRLYENNEDYRERYLAANTAPMYQRWVFPLYTAPQPAPGVAELVGMMGILVAAGNRLNAEAEECTYAGNMAEAAGTEYWCEFRDALETASAALAAHQQGTTNKPDVAGLVEGQARPFHDIDPNWLYSVIRYARKTCFDPDVTEGLREMDEDEAFLVPNLYAAPQPVEQQPATDVSALVEALEEARETIAYALHANASEYFATDADIARYVVIQRIDAVLSSHRKQGGEE